MSTAMWNLGSAAELDDVPPVAFRRAALRQDFEFAQRFPFCGRHLAKFSALVSFAVESLRHCRRTAHFAEQQNFYLKLAALIGHAQPVADPDFARRLGRLPIREHSAEFAGSFRQRPRLEKSRRPQP